MLLPSANEKRADGSRSQPRSIYRHGAFGFVRGRLAALKTAHHLGQNLSDHLLLHSQHKTKQCAVIGHSLQFQRLSQLSVFGQANFRRAERPVLVTHQAQNRQQLRLSETLRRKTMTVNYTSGSLPVQRGQMAQVQLHSCPPHLYIDYEQVQVYLFNRAKISHK